VAAVVVVVSTGAAVVDVVVADSSADFASVMACSRAWSVGASTSPLTGTARSVCSRFTESVSPSLHFPSPGPFQ